LFINSFAAGKRVFELSKAFPRDEMYSLTDQVRRSSRSVSANIAEAWRKRQFEKHFRSTLNIAEREATETQVWIEYAAAHGYLDASTARQADEYYEEIIKMLAAMILKSDQWCSVSSNSKSSPAVKESSATYESKAVQIDQAQLLNL
jgi:four helix bundle protein